MFELPETVTLARQMRESLTGKVVKRGTLGNSPHRFVWYNRSPEEFERLTEGKEVGEARARGRWIFLPLLPGYVLVLGECGGKLLLHPEGARMPDRYHLALFFAEGTFLTLMTQMWGAMELYEKGKESERQYVKDMRPTPLDPEFSFDYFSRLVDSLLKAGKRSVKGLLTQEQLIPGLGNSIAQDILFKAGLHPKRPLSELGPAERRRLYGAILAVVKEAVKEGGRADELDLYGRPGGYVRLMESRKVGLPCPVCGRRIEKVQYLGGACYFCPNCQT